MRADLYDAYGAIDWTNSQLPLIEQEIESWIRMPPYEIVPEDDAAMGKKLLHLRIRRRLPHTLNAAVGATINSLRTSLDLLAASLALRNGKTPSADTHFPIYANVVDYWDPLTEAKRKKFLSSGDLKIIESLKPYRGGNDLLYTLHQLDILRKHERLLRIGTYTSQISAEVAAAEQGLRVYFPLPRFKEDTVIGETSLTATSYDLKFEIAVLFDETSLVATQPIVPLLRQLRGTANSIVQLFE